jgi:hypothetical protein
MLLGLLAAVFRYGLWFTHSPKVSWVRNLVPRVALLGGGEIFGRWDLVGGPCISVGLPLEGNSCKKVVVKGASLCM